MSVVETWPEHEHHRRRYGGFIRQVASHTDGKIKKRGYHPTAALKDCADLDTLKGQFLPGVASLVR
jgi:hypothetical protein